DLPVIRKLYPGWTTAAQITDTLILARLIFGDMRDRDFEVRNGQIKRGLEPTLPGNLIGAQKLEAWGYRLKQMKGEYTEWCKANGIDDPWARWRPEMQRYCEQDVVVTEALYLMLATKGLEDEWALAANIEMRFASLIQLQEAHGFRFDGKAAKLL